MHISLLCKDGAHAAKGQLLAKCQAPASYISSASSDKCSAETINHNAKRKFFLGQPWHTENDGSEMFTVPVILCTEQQLNAEINWGWTAKEKLAHNQLSCLWAIVHDQLSSLCALHYLSSSSSRYTHLWAYLMFPVAKTVTAALITTWKQLK